MDKTTFNKILEELNKQIINSFEKNKKLMVCFAGIPGSGKTFLAKKIEEEESNAEGGFGSIFGDS